MIDYIIMCMTYFLCFGILVILSMCTERNFWCKNKMKYKTLIAQNQTHGVPGYFLYFIVFRVFVFYKLQYYYFLPPPHAKKCYQVIKCKWSYQTLINNVFSFLLCLFLYHATFFSVNLPIERLIGAFSLVAYIIIIIAQIKCSKK